MPTMKTRTASLLPAIAVLAGCASMQPLLWVKQDGTQQEYDTTKYECMKVWHQVESSTPDPCANDQTGGCNLGVAIARLGNPYAGSPAQQMFNSCMTAHGWHLQPQSATVQPFG